MLGHRLIASALAAAALFVTAVMAGPAAATPFAYVPMADHSVWVVDVATGSVITTIVDPSLIGPSYVASSHDAATVYIGNGGSSTVTVISTATNTVKGVIDSGAVCNSVTLAGCTQAVVETLDGSKVYVSNGSTVAVASAATDTVIKQITVGSSPGPLALTPDGRTLYVANINDGTLSLISTATDTVTATTTTGSASGSTAAVLSPDGKTLYVTNGDGIDAISTATNTFVQQLTPTGGFEFGNVAISPDGSTLYVNGFNSTGASVFWLTIASNTTTNTITFPFSSFTFFSGIALTPDGSQLYALAVNFFSTGQTSAYVYDTTTGALVNTIALDQSAGTASLYGNFITPFPLPFVPTLNEWALLMLGGCLAGVGTRAAARRRGPVRAPVRQG